MIGWKIVAVASMCIAFSPIAWGQSESAARCKALQGDHGSIQDAPSQITSAKYVEAAGGVPSHCAVEGYIQPNIGIAMLLPDANWNGKFLKLGCGGFCGALLTNACVPMVKRGYACIVSDMGHKSTGLDAKWGYNNLQAEVDFAFRSTHVTALAGKDITEKYFGKKPMRAFYMGCSTGGRQGMVEAQRFPYDFDGIIAGAPVINETGDGMALLWNVRATLDANGRSILSYADIEKIHAAAIRACDADDGLRDGLIGDPRTCKFDPATVPGITEAQVTAVKKIYGGPVNSKGEAIYTGGALPGSELNWIGQYVAADGGPSTYSTFMTDLFRYIGFMPDPGPSWTLDMFNFDKDYKRLGMMESLFSGSNPDLRKFKSSGGKLLSYQGWADQSVLPLNVVDYYETVERTMGGRSATQDFFRLFMIPGMNHCSGGEGADAIDYLSAMESWVENAKAPDVLMSHHLKEGTVRGQGARPDFPIDPASVGFARPVYPYPIQAKYKGSGDPNVASSFVGKSR